MTAAVVGGGGGGRAGVAHLRRRAEATVGAHALATVTERSGTQLDVRLDKKGAVVGRVHLSELADPGTAAAFPTAKSFHVVVLGPRARKGGGGAASFELTMRPADLARPAGAAPPARPSAADLSVGAVLGGWVAAVGGGLRVTFSPTLSGKVEALDATADPDAAADLGAHFAVGQPVRARACRRRRRDGGGRLRLAIVDDNAAPAAAADGDGDGAATAVGSVVPVRVVRARPGVGVDVQLSGGIVGRAHLTELCDEWVEEPTAHLPPGTIATAVVVARRGRAVDVSLRPAAVRAESTGGADAHARPVAASELEAGELARGYVKAVSERGVFVSLSRTLEAFVGLKQVSDAFVPCDALPQLLPVGRLVVGRLMADDNANGGGGRLRRLSLRRSDVDGTVYEPEAAAGGLTFDDLYMGRVVAGRVRAVRDFGVFVRLEGGKVDGLCHATEVADTKVHDLAASFATGALVKAVVIKLNEEKKQVSLSMKPSRLKALANDDEMEVEVGSKMRPATADDVARGALEGAYLQPPAGADDDDDEEEEDEEEGEEDEEEFEGESDEGEMGDSDEEMEDDGEFEGESGDEAEMMGDSDDDEEEEETRTTTTTPSRTTPSAAARRARRWRRRGRRRSLVALRRLLLGRRHAGERRRRRRRGGAAASGGAPGEARAARRGHLAA